MSPTNYSSISGTVSASVLTSACPSSRVAPSFTASTFAIVSARFFTSAYALTVVSLSVTQQVTQCVRTAPCVAYCLLLHIWYRVSQCVEPVPAHRPVCRLLTTPPSLVPCQPACRPVPAHCSVCRQVSPSRLFSACASPSVSPGVTVSTSASVSASASPSVCAPPSVSNTDYSSISGTVSASVSTSACAPPRVSPTDNSSISCTVSASVSPRVLAAT